MTLDDIDKVTIIRNAFRMVSRMRKVQRTTASIVGEMCGVGPDYAAEVCLSIGWNPDRPATLDPDLPLSS